MYQSQILNRKLLIKYVIDRKDMETTKEVCVGFDLDPCVSYTNCTESGFISYWTELCCQPVALRKTHFWMLSVIGVIGVIGIICNSITIITFSYLCCFTEQLRRSFAKSLVWWEIWCFTSSFTSVFVIFFSVSLASPPTGLFTIMDTFHSLRISASFLHSSGTL